MPYGGHEGGWSHRETAPLANEKATRIGAGGLLKSLCPTRLRKPFPFRREGNDLQLLRLRRRFWRTISLRRPVAAFRHELVELRLVLCVPEPVKEVAKLPLLLL
jgi:hypothetical protein